MQIRDYWLIFSKRWWLPVLVAAVACAASVMYSCFQTPVFRSEVHLAVAPPHENYSMTLTMETWLAQYRQQMLERSLAATVDYNLKLDLPIDTLLGKVNVRTVPDQSRLDVTVDDGDPNRARDIAFAWAQMYIEQHQREASPLDPPNRVEVTMQQTPASGTPLFPNTPAFFLAVGVFGLVLGTVLALLPSSGHTTSA